MPETEIITTICQVFSPSHAYSKMQEAQTITRHKREVYRRTRAPLSTDRAGWQADHFAASMAHGATEARFKSGLLIRAALTPVLFVQGATCLTITLALGLLAAVPSLAAGAVLGIVTGIGAEKGASLGLLVGTGCVIGAFGLTVVLPTDLGTLVADLVLTLIAMMLGALGGAVGYVCGSTQYMPAHFEPAGLLLA